MRTDEEQQLSARLRAELAEVPTEAGLADRALSRVRRQRATSLVVATAAAAVAVVMVPIALEASTGDDTPVAPAVPDPWGPWLAGDVLHLGTTELAAPDAVLLVEVPTGVVYATEPGAVVSLRADGSARTLGTGMNSATRLVSEPRSGWVAWVQHPAEDGPPELVVYDTGAATEVGRQVLATSGPRSDSLDEGAHPISLENGVVYFADYDGDYRWDLTADRGPVRILGPETPELVAHRAGVTVIRRPEIDRDWVYVDHPGAAGGYQALRGSSSGGSLSSEGAYFLPHFIGPAEPRVYSTGDGDRLVLDLAAGFDVTDAVLGSDGTVTYAVVRSSKEPEADPEGPLLEGFVGPAVPADALVTCVIETGECATVADVGADVVFATGWY